MNAPQIHNRQFYLKKNPDPNFQFLTQTHALGGPNVQNFYTSFLIARFEKKMGDYSQLIISLSLLLKEGIFNTVPTMIGTTKDEGLLSSAQYHANPNLYHSIYYRTVGS